MAKTVMLTTVDNPYDPFTRFDRWYLYDCMKGYDTCGRLARIARTSPSLSDAENAAFIEAAMDEIIKYDFMNVYRKVYKDVS